MDRFARGRLPTDKTDIKLKRCHEAVSPTAGNNIADECFLAKRVGVCTDAERQTEQQQISALWVKESDPLPAEILHHQAGVPGHPMGSKKCDYYLCGLPSFDVLTDHSPLVGLFMKDLHSVDTPRLLQLQEKLISYSFKVTWVPGKTRLIADALFCFVFEPDECEDLTINTAVMCLRAERNPALTEVIAAIDRNYHLITYTIKDSLHASKLQSKYPAAQYKKVWDQLSLHEEAGKHMTLLDSAFHNAQTVNCCRVCQEVTPSKPVNTMTMRTPSLSEQPVEEVVDLYNAGGQDWIRYCRWRKTLAMISKTIG